VVVAAVAAAAATTTYEESDRSFVELVSKKYGRKKKAKRGRKGN